jgi:hypothetical protein
MFGASSYHGKWNARYAGTRAFTTVCKGYYTGRIDSARFYAHRVIWALHHGVWPKDQIDHVNGITTDNRIENLRDVDSAENMKNQKSRSNNTSGHIGVSWFTRDSKWRASIKVGETRVHLGYYTKLDDAVAARKSAEIKYGYHKNHGAR